MLVRCHESSFRSRRRSGKSLIELVVVITVMAVVLASGMRLLHVLFRAERTGTHRLADTAALAQLAREFRRDVHGARGSSIVPLPEGGGAPRLELTMPGGQRIIYDSSSRSVMRQVMHGDEVISQRRFRLPGRAVRFEQPSGESAVSLICEPAIPAGASSGTSAAPHLTLRVLAVVGRNARFERPDE